MPSRTHEWQRRRGSRPDATRSGPVILTGTESGTVTSLPILMLRSIVRCSLLAGYGLFFVSVRGLSTQPLVLLGSVKVSRRKRPIRLRYSSETFGASGMVATASSAGVS